MSIPRKILSVIKKIIVSCILILAFAWWVMIVVGVVSEIFNDCSAHDGDATESHRDSGQESMRDVDTILDVVAKVLDDARAIRMSRKYVDKSNDYGDVDLCEEDKRRRERIAELLYSAGNDLLLNGDSMCHRRHEGMELLDYAGGLGCVQAWSELGYLYEEKGFSTGDFSRSVAYLKAAAEMGDPDAMGGLSEIYWFGLGVSCNRSNAVEWAKQAIETRRAAGVLDSYYYGLAYLNGEGNLSVDVKRALTLFRKGAEASVSCSYSKMVPDKRVLIFYQLGRMYMEGIGVPVDLNQAILWFDKCSKTDAVSNQPEWNTAVRQAADATASIKNNIEKSFRDYLAKDKTISEVWKIVAVLKKNPNTDMSVEMILRSDISDAKVKAMDIKTEYEISIEQEIKAEARIKQIGDVKLPARSNKIYFVRKNDRWIAQNVSGFLKQIYVTIKSHYRNGERYSVP